MTLLSTILIALLQLPIAIYGTGAYAGNSLPTSTIPWQCTWVRWVYAGPNTAAYKAAGCKTIAYVQVWRAYTAEHTANDTLNNSDLLGTNAAALARSCNGSVLTTVAYGGTVYLLDPRVSLQASRHLNTVVNAVYSRTTPDALFLDNTSANGDFPAPCNYSYSGWLAAVKAVAGTSPHALFENLLTAWTNGGSPAGNVAAESANTIGGMSESTYLSNAGPVSGKRWLGQEQGQIASGLAGKVAWIYERNTAAADSGSGRVFRLYGLASFLLPWDGAHAMIQSAFYTPSQFPVMPEYGLVPSSPLTTSSTVGGYLRAGLYVREYGACAYRGVARGRCAIVVNPGTVTTSNPLASFYARSLTLAGGGVREGGTVGFAGGRVTYLAPLTGAVLFTSSASHRAKSGHRGALHARP